MKVFIEEYGMLILQFIGGLVVLMMITLLLGSVGWKIIEYNISALVGNVT